MFCHLSSCVTRCLLTWLCDNSPFLSIDPSPWSGLFGTHSCYYYKVFAWLDEGDEAKIHLMCTKLSICNFQLLNEPIKLCLLKIHKSPGYALGSKKVEKLQWNAGHIIYIPLDILLVRYIVSTLNHRFFRVTIPTLVNISSTKPTLLVCSAAADTLLICYHVLFVHCRSLR